MSYNRLYLYAVGQDYDDLLDKFDELSLHIFTQDGERSPDLDQSKSQLDTRMWYLSKKPVDEVRRSFKGGFSEATFDVASWSRGYVYKDRQIVGHMIKQTLPIFNRPNPTEAQLQEIEDAKEIRKITSRLRRWMKKNWIDHYNDGDFFGPEALKLKLEQGYSDASYELDNEPTTIYILPE